MKPLAYAMLIAFLTWTSAAYTADSSLEPVMIAIPGKNYEIGKTAVTQGQYRSVMGNNPSMFTNCGDNCPVEHVSWNDAQEFIQRLNSKTGKQYRLPTEKEWEYACYGGMQTEYCGGDDLDVVGWYKDNSNGQTHPVGQKQANSYGLYDMSGNVWQWMNDSYDAEQRVLRGGCWGDASEFARVVSRDGDDPADRINSYGLGFRLARTHP